MPVGMVNAHMSEKPTVRLTFGTDESVSIYNA